MNRTDRLYAIVEELRAVAPRPRSATWLARRFEVTARTVERDLAGLRDAGVPIWSQPGRSGGYVLDPQHSLPPLTLTAGEALALGVALGSLGRSPFAAEARTAVQKVLARLPADVRQRERHLAERVHVVPGTTGPGSRHDGALREAVARGRVVRLRYRDARGDLTDRDVEPLALLWSEPDWYLVGWCRLRDAVRGFRADRVEGATVTDEHPPARDDTLVARELARFDARSLATT